MKIPITDQFLWDVYNFLEGAGEVAHLIFRRRRTMRDLPGSENPILKKYFKNLSRAQFDQLIYRLKKNNYIKAKSLKGGKAIMLTKKGLDKAIRASFKIEAQKREKRKDGKWIMLIFDIPKRDMKKRGLMREMFQNLGYKMFQKSVWVTPYDVFNKTEKFIQFHSLDQYIRLLLVEEMQ